MKILIVDDDSNIRLIVRMSLAGDQINIVEAENGRQALGVAASEQPDLILMDMMMPDMDGRTTLGKLREEESTGHIPVIFLTAKVQKHEMESYIKLGAAGVITKPFDPMTLADEISDIMSDGQVDER